MKACVNTEDRDTANKNLLMDKGEAGMEVLLLFFMRPFL
jgi:hypothetical protein